MLGKELRKARIAAKLTQEQLAFSARVDRSYISELENDKKSPTLDMLFRLCDVMQVKPSTLISRVERQRP
jgi:transcriptional regulator with XRE-family HTH domain